MSKTDGWGLTYKRLLFINLACSSPKGEQTDAAQDAESRSPRVFLSIGSSRAESVFPVGTRVYIQNYGGFLLSNSNTGLFGSVFCSFGSATTMEQNQKNPMYPPADFSSNFGVW